MKLNVAELTTYFSSKGVGWSIHIPTGCKNQMGVDQMNLQFQTQFSAVQPPCKFSSNMHQQPTKTPLFCRNTKIPSIFNLKRPENNANWCWCYNTSHPAIKPVAFEPLSNLSRTLYKVLFYRRCSRLGSTQPVYGDPILYLHRQKLRSLYCVKSSIATPLTDRCG